MILFCLSVCLIVGHSSLEQKRVDLQEISSNLKKLLPDVIDSFTHPSFTCEEDWTGSLAKHLEQDIGSTVKIDLFRAVSFVFFICPSISPILAFLFSAFLHCRIRGLSDFRLPICSVLRGFGDILFVHSVLIFPTDDWYLLLKPFLFHLPTVHFTYCIS